MALQNYVSVTMPPEKKSSPREKLDSMVRTVKELGTVVRRATESRATQEKPSQKRQK